MQYGISNSKGDVLRKGLTKSQALEISGKTTYIPVYLDGIYKGLHIWKPMCQDNRAVWDKGDQDGNSNQLTFKI